MRTQKASKPATRAKRPPLGRRNPEGRRQAILDAGLAVFAAKGFEASKLDDVAEKAGVAKGTIYLHFRDKQDLLEQIVRNAAAPVLGKLEDVAKLPDMPLRAALQAMFALFLKEVIGTKRKHVVRLVLTEGARFPAIAKFYHREVISRGMSILRELLHRAHASGEIASADLEKFPQLVLAPLILAVIWDGVFARIEALDFEGMFAAHCDLLIGRGSPSGEPR
jgi:AcrR family transcriptional regulator